MNNLVYWRDARDYPAFYFVSYCYESWNGQDAFALDKVVSQNVSASSISIGEVGYIPLYPVEHHLNDESYAQMIYDWDLRLVATSVQSSSTLFLHRAEPFDLNPC